MIKGYPDSFVLKGPFQLTGKRQDPGRDTGCSISGCPELQSQGQPEYRQGWAFVVLPAPEPPGEKKSTETVLKKSGADV